MEPANKIFGKRLKEYRSKSKDPNSGKSLTQKEVLNLLFELTGCDEPLNKLSYWENGEREIGKDNRIILIGLIKVFYVCGGIEKVEQADRLLLVGNYAPLSEEEKKEVWGDATPPLDEEEKEQVWGNEISTSSLTGPRGQKQPPVELEPTLENLVTFALIIITFFILLLGVASQL